MAGSTTSTSIVPEGGLAYGIQLPIQTLTRTLREPWEEDATVADLVRVAQAAEAAGCGFVGVCDHVAFPENDYTRHMTPTWDVGANRLTGSAEQIAESLRFAREVGCTVLHVRFRSRTRDELCDQIAAFGRDVGPLL